MRPLVQIISHAGGSTWRQAIRDTWLEFGGVEHRFVIGAGAVTAHDDTITVAAPDGYDGIAFKVREGLRFALQDGYDFVFTCFTDTYVSVPRLLLSNFERHHYSGCCIRCPEGYQDLSTDGKGRFSYASGGPGYWLSRRAMEIVVATEPRSQYDDMWIGWELGLHGLPCFNDNRYGHHGDRLYPEQITCHLSKGTGNYDPAWMYQAHGASE